MLSAEEPEWCNLGQGPNRNGPLAGAPAARHPSSTSRGERPRVRARRGLWKSAKPCQQYNNLFRRGMQSQYTRTNVAVCGGGRVSHRRALRGHRADTPGPLFAGLYGIEEVLDVFRRFTPITICWTPSTATTFTRRITQEMK